MNTAQGLTDRKDPHRYGANVVEAFCDALRGADFQGDIQRDKAARLIHASDNSIYQRLPALVLAPKDRTDLKRIFDLARQKPFSRLTFTGRGGGTGTNGQSLTHGIVIDTSRHLTRILHLNLDEEWVEVEAGVVLDQLNAYLRPHGYSFAPTTSTASRATLGGMISTDAAGKGSRLYGKTSDHVLGLSCILADGQLLDTDPSRDSVLRPSMERRAEDILAPLRREIDANYPKLPRGVSGYNLQKALRPQGSVDLNYLLAGAEGTLCLVQSAKLKITRLPKFRRLVVVRYPSFEAALEDVPRLLDADPLAVEIIDDKIHGLSKNDPAWPQVKSILTGPAKEHQPVISNFVEFIADEESQVEDQATALVKRLNASGHTLGAHISRESSEMSALWSIRAGGVGLLANMPGRRQPVPFIEDTAVPPQNLADYMKDLRALLDEAHVKYGIFGHADAGVLHVRPALDMTDEKDREKVRSITQGTITLLKKHDGVLWGEHGKGVRAEFIPAFFTPPLVQAMQDIKTLFDPDDRFNPGKVIAPRGTHQGVLSIDAPTFRGEVDGLVPANLRANWDRAFACNGNGKCFAWDASQPMCPSYKATGDRMHSPKGRAVLIREWLRLKSSDKTGASLGQDKSERDKAYHTYKHIEADLFTALEGCLSCKACSGTCPVKVDIPDMKSRFLQDYHTRHIHPLRDYIFAYMENLVPWLSRMPGLGNWMTGGQPGKWVLKKIIGLEGLPAFPSGLARKERRDIDAHILGEKELDNLHQETSGTRVGLVPDMFTRFFEPHILLSAVHLLQNLGYKPFILPYVASGKGAQVKGFMVRYKKAAIRQSGILARMNAQNIPLIGLEPSTVIMLRQEYKKVLNPKPDLKLDWENENTLQDAQKDVQKGGEQDADLAVYLLPEFLRKIQPKAPRSSQKAKSSGRRYTLMLHCTEATNAFGIGKAWQEAFHNLGLELDIADVGCCGMAGAYGLESKHQSTSRKIYDLSWREKIRDIASQDLLVSGFSCRSQVLRYDELRLRHPVELLAQWRADS